MKHLLNIAILLLATYCLSQEQANDQSHFLDFWLGTWEVSWEEPNGVKGSGINEIKRILDDKVIQENFRVLKGNSEGFKGTSLSVYQPRIDTWKQAWADNQGVFYNFDGEMENDMRCFKTEVFERNGNKYVFRMLFKNIKDNSFIWHWESSQDGGKTWKLNWEINYKRLM